MTKIDIKINDQRLCWDNPLEGVNVNLVRQLLNSFISHGRDYNHKIQLSKGSEQNVFNNVFKLLTDLRILQLQWFAVFFNFWARSLDFACDKVRIVDLSDRQKCLFLFVFVCVRCCSFVVVVFLYGQDSPNVTQ